MTTDVSYIPKGYHSVTPCLTVHGVERLLEFLTQAFDAEVTERVKRPDGKVGHAEVRIGDSMVMMGEARDQWKPTSSSLYVYVRDADATYQRALRAGATSLMEPADQFYGDRHGGVQDPFGNQWWIATHTEDVPKEEMERRAKAHMK